MFGTRKLGRTSDQRKAMLRAIVKAQNGVHIVKPEMPPPLGPLPA